VTHNFEPRAQAHDSSRVDIHDDDLHRCDTVVFPMEITHQISDRTVTNVLGLEVRERNLVQIKTMEQERLKELCNKHEGLNSATVEGQWVLGICRQALVKKISVVRPSTSSPYHASRYACMWHWH